MRSLRGDSSSKKAAFVVIVIAAILTSIFAASCGGPEDDGEVESIRSYPVAEGCDGEPRVEFSVELPRFQNDAVICVMNDDSGRFIPSLPTAAENSARDRGFTSECPTSVFESCSGAPKPIGDAGDSVDADVSSPDAAFDARCEDLVTDYQAQVERFRACDDVEDCQLIEGTKTCNGAFALGDSSGDPVNTDFVYPADWAERLAACESYIDGLPKRADAAPAEDLRCESGECQADSRSCIF